VKRHLTFALAQWLTDSPQLEVGEILVRRQPGGFELLHRDDLKRNDLAAHTRAEDARLLATLDDHDTYRPLKSAPNLRHGWRLLLTTPEEVRIALDYFYPAALGLFTDWQQQMLTPVDLRETLGRQSGMYAITRKITNEQAQEMIGAFCTSQGGCLKTILWNISPGLPICSLPPEKFDAHTVRGKGCNLPLLCHEACNLLVAKAREVVKSAAKAE